jgi:TetR/AcrR family transcriptional regulator, ethionamide resistance regulator
VSRDERRKELRELLKAAAERLFATGFSYAEITVEQLVTEAQTSRTRFYTYFDDKSDLLRSWFSDVRRDLVAVDDAWWAVRGDATEADLAEAIRKILLAYRPHDLLMAAMYDLAAVDRTTREEIDAMEADRAKRLETHITRGQQEGWIDPGLLPRETASWLTVTGARGYEQMVGVDGDEEDIDQFVGSYAQYVWFVLYAQAPHLTDAA